MLPRTEEGERVSVLPLVPDMKEAENRDAAELEEERRELRKRVEAYLRSEPELVALFGCLYPF